MSFGHHTPESLLPRSDSKNPSTTCKGITNTGRPCRRGLASPGTSPAPSPTRGHGVLAVLQDRTIDQSNAAAFYCWQHKEQADQLVAADTTKTKLYPLKEKSSIDTLVDRLGVLDLEEDAQQNHRQKRRKHGQATIKKRDTMPAGWHDIQGPLTTVPEGFERPEHRPRTRPSPSHGRSNLKASFLCCLRADDDDLPPARILPNSSRPAAYQKPREPSNSNLPDHNARPALQDPKLEMPRPVHRKPVASPTSPGALDSSPRHRSAASQSQSQLILSRIPKVLQPQTIAALMAEAARPLTVNDFKISGYIYIFWLTPEAEGDGPDSDIASTILDDASPGRSSIQDQMLERYSSQRRKSGTGRDLGNRAAKSVLLKIGRATNVHRRMNQWQKQCGHNITLLRYYPNTSDSKTPAQEPVPLLPRVERLIQIELEDLRVKQDKCARCGREHREWFEVDASRRGLRVLDECVRRWVAWGREESRRLESSNRDVITTEGYY